jgi:hypothetical protein
MKVVLGFLFWFIPAPTRTECDSALDRQARPQALAHSVRGYRV